MLGVYVFTSTGIIEKLKIQSFKKNICAVELHTVAECRHSRLCSATGGPDVS